MGDRTVAYRVFVGKPEGKRPLGRPRRRWGIILRWIFRNWDVGMWTVSSLLKIGTGGPRKRGNGLSVSINCGELFD